MQFDLNNYIKIQKCKNIMFLLLYFMLMRKNVKYTTEKQNMTSYFVSVCCCIINLTTWQ